MQGRLEQFIAARGLISDSDLDRVADARKAKGESAFRVLKRLGIVQSVELAAAMAEFYGLPLVRNDQWPPTPILADHLNLAFLREHKVFPLSVSEDGLVLAMADPDDAFALNAVGLATGRAVKPAIASEEDIDAAVERVIRSIDRQAHGAIAQAADIRSEDVERLRDIALGAPVVQFVNQLLQEAVYKRATDIHIEPFENRLSVRLRVDGMLRESSPPPSHLGRAVISRIKILSGLNIAERRLPQDGRARIRLDREQFDVRIATMPTIHGECVVIRLLNNVRRTLNLKKLGFEASDEAVLRRHLDAPHGMILVTGPTGSGKTTTLATALHLLNQPHRKILSVEDPIEYEIEGVNQVHVRPEIGLSFATALRGFLRHDPEVIMVGEMRDAETAHIGVHAALTGHLVLSTLHTNSAAGSVTRLLDMGVDGYLLASSLRLVVGQRLVRLLCPECKEPYQGQPDFPGSTLVSAGFSPNGPAELWRPKGCDRCFGSGFSDRIAILECLEINDDVRRAIRPGVSSDEIERVALRSGMTTMVVDGLRKSRAGLTSPEEVRRVALDI